MPTARALLLFEHCGAFTLARVAVRCTEARAFRMDAGLPLPCTPNCALLHCRALRRVLFVPGRAVATGPRFDLLRGPASCPRMKTREGGGTLSALTDVKVPVNMRS